MDVEDKPTAMDIDEKQEQQQDPLEEQRKADQNAALQALFTSRVQGFFKQLTVGCGRSNCDNCLCLSNPALKKYKLSPNEAAVLAMNLARNGKLVEQFMCSEPVKKQEGPVRPFIDSEMFENMVAEAKKTNVYTPLIRIFGTVFGSPESISISFLQNPKLVTIDDTGLDIEGVRKFYQTVDELPLEVQDSLASSFERLFHELKYNKTQTRGGLRQYIILLENPKLLDNRYTRVVGPVLTAITQLPQNMLDFLQTNYVGKFDQKRFSEFNQTLQDFIAVRILAGDDDFVPTNDNAIIAATKIIGWLWTLNKSKKYLPPPGFYNQVVNDNVDLKKNYMNWKKVGQTRKFSFCQYPFILTPEVKSKFLNIEALIAQRTLREEAYQMLYQGIVDEMPLPYFVVRVRRTHLIEDSIDSIRAIKLIDSNSLKKQLRVEFAGEEGIDEGGVKKEWFQLVVQDLFSLKYGMFIQDDETRTHWFNQRSHDFDAFELLGMVLALAIYNGVILDLHFPLFVYKKLCAVPPALADLAEINPGLCRGLNQLLKFGGDISDMDLNFRIQYEYYGSLEMYDLKPDGEQIRVTNENRQEFVDLYLHYLLDTSVAPQFDAFKRGFDTVCSLSGPALQMFGPDELQLLICGSPVLNFEDLELNGTSYENGYDKDHPTVKNFWEVVHGMSIEEKKQLLFFATGSDRSPIGGLGKLNLVITRQVADTDRLPTSHTCFNHLILPDYESKKKLDTMLKKAIANSTGFGLL